MAAYQDLTDAGVSTRDAAELAGVARSSAMYKPRTPAAPERMAPLNKLSDRERARILATLNLGRFVDLPPVQIFAQPLDEDTYYCSISTMYRILGENHQVKERRRLARHPARKVPELVATAPGQVYTWDITKLAGPVKGKYFDCYIHDRHLLPLHRRRLRPHQ